MDFHQKFYIPEIQKLAFFLPHVFIFVAHHCGNTHREAFKIHAVYQNVLCRCDYAKHLVSRFAHQIRSEHYGGNKSLSIEGISLGHFSAIYQEISLSCFHSLTRHSFSLLSVLSQQTRCILNSCT